MVLQLSLVRCHAGNAFENEIPKVLVTPETVFMRPDGKIALDKQPLQPFLSSDFCAPEWRDEPLSNTDSSVEKVSSVLGLPVTTE